MTPKTLAILLAVVVTVQCTIDCSLVRCGQPQCQDGQESFLPPGQCCEMCRNCSDVECRLSICLGRLETPPGKCCPECVPCNLLDCALPQCVAGSSIITLPGQCCPTCGPIDPCLIVLCIEPLCVEGEESFIPPGQCCLRCRPTTPDCSAVLCISPNCNKNEEIFTPPGECCPQCRPIVPDCSAVLCISPNCNKNEEIFTPPGECCPQCRPTTPDCSAVLCLRPVCATDEELFTPPGQCCPQCRPTTPDCSAVLCLRPVCATDEELFTPPGQCCPQCRPCSTVLCISPNCNKLNEVIFTPPGECCPSCRPRPDCSVVNCALPVCPGGTPPITPPGECCPICEINCLLVLCVDPVCGEGEVKVTPDGQCCPVCQSACPIEGQVLQGCKTCPATCRNPGLCTRVDLQCTFGCGCPSGQLIDEENNRCVDPEDCPSDCPNGQIFSSCPGCPQTCNEVLNGEVRFCPAVCRPGCACPPGTLIDSVNGGCVEFADCPNPCALIDCVPFARCKVSDTGEGFCELSCEIANGGCPEDTTCTLIPIQCLIPPCPPAIIECIPRCPPECSKTFCNKAGNRRALCTVPGPREIPGCTGECQLSYCHACYYSEDPFPLPGNCPASCEEGLTTDNICFRHWANCIKRAHRRTNGIAVNQPAEDFKCYRPSCPLRG